jgi:serine/threonine protein phosphatase PrpC
MVVFNHSVQGVSHIKNGKPCQDASLCVKNETYKFIAVSDGHGDERYFRSDVGSKCAVLAAKECMTLQSVIDALKKEAQEKTRENVIIPQLKKSVISRWNTLISAHYNAYPFTEEELSAVPDKYAAKYRAGEQIESAYGATIIAALLTDTFLLAMQIGDGCCAVMDADGNLSIPVPECAKCVGNMTTSLCEADAFDNFRHYFVCPGNAKAAVIIATDGIEKSFSSEETLLGFFRVMVSSFTKKDEEEAKAELFDYLPRMSEKGSGDDISIGLVASLELLQAINFEPEEIEGSL